VRGRSVSIADKRSSGHSCRGGADRWHSAQLVSLQSAVRTICACAHPPAQAGHPKRMGCRSRDAPLPSRKQVTTMSCEPCDGDSMLDSGFEWSDVTHCTRSQSSGMPQNLGGCTPPIQSLLLATAWLSKIVTGRRGLARRGEGGGIYFKLREERKDGRRVSRYRLFARHQTSRAHAADLNERRSVACSRKLNIWWRTGPKRLSALMLPFRNLDRPVSSENSKPKIRPAAQN
jgi:hypothetical protein